MNRFAPVVSGALALAFSACSSPGSGGTPDAGTGAGTNPFTGVVATVPGTGTTSNPAKIDWKQSKPSASAVKELVLEGPAGKDNLPASLAGTVDVTDVPPGAYRLGARHSDGSATGCPALPWTVGSDATKLQDAAGACKDTDVNVDASGTLHLDFGAASDAANGVVLVIDFKSAATGGDTGHTTYSITVEPKSISGLPQSIACVHSGASMICKETESDMHGGPLVARFAVLDERGNVTGGFVAVDKPAGMEVHPGAGGNFVLCGVNRGIMLMSPAGTILAQGLPATTPVSEVDASAGPPVGWGFTTSNVLWVSRLAANLQSLTAFTVTPPAGAPPIMQTSVIRANAAGSVAVLGDIGPDFQHLDTYVFVIGADNTYAWGKQIAVPPPASGPTPSPVETLAWTAEGDVVLAGAGYAAKLKGVDGDVLWVKDYTPIPKVRSLHVLADGNLLVGADYAVGTDRGAYVQLLSGADGSVVWTKKYTSPLDGLSEGVDVAPTAAGGIQIGAVTDETSWVVGTLADGSVPGCTTGYGDAVTITAADSTRSVSSITFTLGQPTTDTIAPTTYTVTSEPPEATLVCGQ